VPGNPRRGRRINSRSAVLIALGASALSGALAAAVITWAVCARAAHAGAVSDSHDFVYWNEHGGGQEMGLPIKSGHMFRCIDEARGDPWQKDTFMRKCIVAWQIKEAAGASEFLKKHPGDVPDPRKVRCYTLREDQLPIGSTASGPYCFDKDGKTYKWLGELR